MKERKKSTAWTVEEQGIEGGGQTAQSSMSFLMKSGPRRVVESDRSIPGGGRRLEMDGSN